jgi:hypothetical protein
MQAVFARCGYRQEGRMVEAWKNADGSRSDTLLYAILRQEFTARSRDERAACGDPSSSRQRPALSHRDSTNEDGNAASAD